MKFLRIILISAALVATGRANTYIYKPIERVPKAEEVIAFTNGKPPATGERKHFTKQEIMRFLSHGTPLKDRKKWLRRSPSLSEVKDGVFFDATGRAYFWSIWMEGVLFLETENGESIQIILNDEKA